MPMPALRRAAALTLLTLCGSAAFSASPGNPHWSYKGQHAGPAHWGSLDTAFEACAKGRAQSPVDLGKSVKADLPPVEPRYTTLRPVVINNGHTIQVEVGAGQTLQVGDQRYELLQFHFHTPSEESINGRRAAMVAHFVHRDAQGRLGVFAVLLEAGNTHAGYRTLLSRLPRAGERIESDEHHLDLRSLLPQRLSYFAYEGSLTTPPCSEGVQWHVFQEPVRIGMSEIKAFRRLFPANARPVQPLNGREVRASP